MENKIIYHKLFINKNEYIKIHLIPPQRINNKKPWALIINGKTLLSISHIDANNLALEINKSDKDGKIINLIKDAYLKKGVHNILSYMSLLKYNKFINNPYKASITLNNTTKEEAFKIIDGLRNNNIVSITYYGLNDDIIDIIDYSKDFYNELVIDDVDKLNENDYIKLKESGLDSIIIDLYSYDENIHNQLAKKNNFTFTLNSIKLALNAKINTCVNTLLFNINKDYLKTLIFCNVLKVKSYRCVNKEIKEEVLKGIIIESKEYLDQYHLDFSFMSDCYIDKNFLNKHKVNNLKKDDCILSINVLHNGNITASISNKVVLGNIYNKPWKRIINGSKAKKIKYKILRHEVLGHILNK